MADCVGTVLTLKGLSKKGKERIRQYGNKWEIVGLGGDIGTPGIKRLRIKSHPITNQSDHRWIQCGHDEDFEIVAF